MMKRTLLALAMLLGTTNAHAAGLTCPEEQQLHAVKGDVATSITFVNQTRRPVRVYWINYKGDRQFYAEVAPGRSYDQQTYVTHPWVVTNNAEDCLGVYLPQRSPTSAIIQ